MIGIVLNAGTSQDPSAGRPTTPGIRRSSLTTILDIQCRKMYMMDTYLLLCLPTHGSVNVPPKVERIAKLEGAVTDYE